MLVTKEKLIQMLSNDNPAYVDLVIGRALVAIFKRQTQAERESNQTEEHNGIGFTGFDGRSGALTAKYFLKHNRLDTWQREAWLKKNKKGEPRIAKYWKQLNEVAESRA